MRPFKASARKYAGAGYPVFRLAPGTNVPMAKSHGFKDATTDLEQIREWIAETPAANVGLATGEVSGIIAFETDPRHNGEETRERLEEELEPLPETFEYTSPRGGTYRLYRIPEGTGHIKSSAAEGFDVKADGGYAAMPPSQRLDGLYSVSRHREMAVCPMRWMEWAQTRQRSKRTEEALHRLSVDAPAGRRGRSAPPERKHQQISSTPIPRGERWITLRSIAGRLNDGTRSEQEIYADLLNVPLEQPPGDTFTEEEVAKIASWAHQREPCSPPSDKGERNPAVAEKVRKWEHVFLRMFGEGFRELDGQTDRDVLRMILEGMAEHGREAPDGGTEFDMSLQDIADRAGACRQTVSTAAKRLHRTTGLVHDTYHRRRKEAGTWRLPKPPAHALTSQPISLPRTIEEREIEGDVKSCAPPRLVGQETPCYAHFGTVGKGRGGILLALRMYGPLDDDGLEAATGIRARDIRRRYLRDIRRKDGTLKVGLLAMGLVEERDGVYALPEDADRREQRELTAAYSTIRCRKVWRLDPVSGRTVTTVEEVGSVASQNQRQVWRRAQYERERAWFHERLKAEARRPEEDREIVKLLNRWMEERQDADGRVEDMERIKEGAA